MKAAAVLSVLFAIIAGCSRTPSGPTYAEAVAVYQDEQKELERMEGERAAFERKMVALHKQLLDLLRVDTNHAEINKSIDDLNAKWSETLAKLKPAIDRQRARRDAAMAEKRRLEPDNLRNAGN